MLIKEGDRAALIGCNGSGKSTYIKSVIECILLGQTIGVVPAKEFDVISCGNARGGRGLSFLVFCRARLPGLPLPNVGGEPLHQGKHFGSAALVSQMPCVALRSRRA